MGLKNILESGEDVDLVVQGGGMRGVYSVAALSQLDQMGYKDRFRNIFATSSGAINGAYFLTGQAEEGIVAYTDHLSNKNFIDYKRVKKIVDIDFLVDTVLAKKVVLDQTKLKESKSVLNIGLVCTQSGSIVFKNQHTIFPLNEVFRAAAALPLLYGKEILLGGNRYVDGGLISTAPVKAAQENGSKNILVILTRDQNHQVSEPGFIQTKIMKTLAAVRGHSKSVIDHLPKLDHDMDFLLNKNLPSNIYIIQPEFERVSRTTKEKDILLNAAESAKEDVKEALR